MTVPVLYEDDDIIVFNKPPDCVVNEAESTRGETLQAWQRSVRNFSEPAEQWFSLVPQDFSLEYGSPEEIFTERAGMVHRLDKDTSGVILFAKNPGSLVNLLAQFRNRTVHKEYLALTHGTFQTEHEVVKLPIGRATGENRQRFQVTVQGRPAETEIARVASYNMSFASLLPALDARGMRRGRSDSQLEKEYSTYGQFTLVRCHPKTGRTHQIRVHCAYLQHPLVSDYMYGGRKVALDMLWCPRQFLHAAVLRCVHPRTGMEMTFEAPLTSDLEAALSTLSKA